MNIHTFFVMKLKEKTDLKKHHASILKKLDSVLSTIDGLREDPLFIDGIHGEQDTYIASLSLYAHRNWPALYPDLSGLEQKERIEMVKLFFMGWLMLSIF